MKSYKQKVNERNRMNPKAIHLADDMLKRLQKTLLEMYLDIQSVCEKHGLTCFLIGGSALGAVRHKGFIPWDDDLDVGMHRNDYEKFKVIFKAELGDKYILNAPNYEGIPTNRFAKVLKRGTKFVELGMPDDDRACIKIDVFVIENVPDNYIFRLFKGIYCNSLMLIGSCVLSYECWKMKNAGERNNMNERVLIGKLFSFNSSKAWFDCVDNACQHGNDKSVFIGTPTGRTHYFGEILKREVYFPVKTAVFEGKKVYLPGNVGKHLSNLYGDYMKIPPEDKRERHYVSKISF